MKTYNGEADSPIIKYEIMESDFLKKGDKVFVAMFDSEGKEVWSVNLIDVHNIADAITQAYAASPFENGPENYVFKVVNETTDVAHRYRLNADGNVVLLPEEY